MGSQRVEVSTHAAIPKPKSAPYPTILPPPPTSEQPNASYASPIRPPQVLESNIHNHRDVSAPGRVITVDFEDRNHDRLSLADRSLDTRYKIHPNKRMTLVRKRPSARDNSSSSDASASEVHHDNLDTGKEESDDDDERPSKKRRSGAKDGEKAGQRLACPFFRFDPFGNWACGKYNLKSASRVKQHIFRVHCLPDVYCPICWKFWRPGEQDHMYRHVRRQGCKPRKAPIAGTTEAQKAELGRLRPARGTAEGQADRQQWTNMWEILFPEHPNPPPNLVYMGGTIAEAVFVVQSAIQRSGDVLLSELFPGDSDARNTVRSAIPAILDRLRHLHCPPKGEFAEKNQPTSSVTGNPPAAGVHTSPLLSHSFSSEPCSTPECEDQISESTTTVSMASLATATPLVQPEYLPAFTDGLLGAGSWSVDNQGQTRDSYMAYIPSSPDGSNAPLRSLFCVLEAQSFRDLEWPSYS